MIIEARKKGVDDGEDKKCGASNKSSKTIKSLSKTMKALEKDNRWLKKSVGALQKCDEDEESSLSSEEGSSHFQDAMEMFEEHPPKVVLALKSSKFTNLDLMNVLLLDNQLTFDLCCNKTFASKIIKAERCVTFLEVCMISPEFHILWSKKAR